MTKNNLLGSQIRHLLSSLSGHGKQHLTEVETDLVQTTYLLSEAIEKLGASFMAIHEGVAAQQEAVDTLLAGEAATPEMAWHAEGIARRRCAARQCGCDRPAIPGHDEPIDRTNRATHRRLARCAVRGRLKQRGYAAGQRTGGN